ncbi:MAG: hypothetical protein HYV97_04725 [Bdellovibrio sp.]|nr:hypothetical protein [Bdellovibrio sp.]
MKLLSLFILLLLCISGCATHKYSKQTKLVALSNDITRGPSIGPIEGRDCRWRIFGIKLSDGPTLDQAIQDALSRTQLETFAENVDPASSGKPPIKIRYINNINTSNEGYNLGFVEKKCLVLSGVGHL